LAAAIRNAGYAPAPRRREAADAARANAQIERQFAGFIEAPAPPKAATYKITLSSEGWIDIVQNGRRVRSVTSTGATGCNGVRKSVKFDLAAAPFTVQLSDVEANSVGLVISE
jgi:hypothetical protein